MRHEINQTWDHRAEITPRYKVPEKPNVIEILKCLPKTNCREPTCLVFALRVAEGAKNTDACPYLAGGPKTALETYLSGFVFDD